MVVVIFTIVCMVLSITGFSLAVYGDGIGARGILPGVIGILLLYGSNIVIGIGCILYIILTRKIFKYSWIVFYYVFIYIFLYFITYPSIWDIMVDAIDKVIGNIKYRHPSA